MTRMVDVSALTERELQNTVLLLAAYSKDLRRILEDAAKHSGFLRHELESVQKEHGPRLAFLERAWTREVDHHAVERKAARMDRVWGEIEARP